MKFTQKLLYKSFFAAFLLLAVYGCQTTSTTATSGPSIEDTASDKTQSDAEYVEHAVPQTNTVNKEVSAASVTVTGEADTKGKREKEIMEKFGNNFVGILRGHGGTPPPSAPAEKKAVSRDKQVEDPAARSAYIKNRPYIETEKRLYGKWNNKLKTESYDFNSDGTVKIVVSGPRGKTHTLNGNYRIVEAERIKIDFRNDSMASQMPPRYFKLTISENSFSLTDEPKEKDGPDGSTTKYNRVE